MEFPLWATPARRARLVELSGFQCPLGDKDCPSIERFVQGVVSHIGLPGPAGWLAWVFRAALVTPKVLRELPQGDLWHLPFWVTRVLIEEWKADDRIERSIAWRREKRRLHSAPHQLFPKVLTRDWDSVVQENYLANRPIFQIVGVGVNAFTQHRVAEVSIPGLKLTIWVDLSGIKVSKNKFHKLARYKRGALPKEIVAQVEARVAQQVAKVL